ncbi:MAG: DUF5076 domain-containing protein [Hyphomicrobiaceae bacterium]
MTSDETTELHELELPDGVHDARRADEILRAWVADGSLHVIFNPETFSHDVSEWGRMLGDIAQHIATAVELDGQMPREQALALIAEAFARGVTDASAPGHSGHIKGRVSH